MNAPLVQRRLPLALLGIRTAPARHLGVPEAICTRPPTTDTYSLAQGQDEFYFVLPYRQMDLALWAFDHGVAAGELAGVLGLSQQQADHVYEDIRAKRRSTAYLHMRTPPLGEAAVAAREFLALYPTARILVADETNFTKDKRHRFLSRAATATWDDGSIRWALLDLQADVGPDPAGTAIVARSRSTLPSLTWRPPCTSRSS